MSEEGLDSLEGKEATIGGGGDNPVVDPPQTWPDQWRENILGGPEAIKDNDQAAKELERLSALTSPADIWKKYRALEADYSKRAPRIEYDPEMPEDKLRAYREQEGIPTTWQDYKLEFESGLVVGENDKPFVDNFLEYAHKNNMPESQVKSAVEYYLTSQEQQASELAEKAKQVKFDTLSSLKAEWGPEFEGNVNSITELFVDHPEIKDILMTARDEDGLPIGNHLDVVRWAVDLAKKINPLATMTLPGGENGMVALDARINELKEQMRDRETWFRTPELRKEYEDLVAKRDAVKNREAR